MSDAAAAPAPAAVAAAEAPAAGAAEGAQASATASAAGAPPAPPPRKQASESSTDGTAAAGDEEDDGYKAPPKTETLEEIMARKEEDESLAKYKAALLGNVALGEGYDGRQVVIEELKLDPEGHAPICFDLSTPEKIAAAEARTVVAKEGASYVMSIRFKVYKDIVVGLKFHSQVYKMKVPVEKQSQMIGAYAPKAEAYTFSFPRASWPSGFMMRGSYLVKIKVTDDDKNTHLDMSYKFELKKDWE